MDLKKYYIDIAYQHFADFGPGQFTFDRIVAESGIPFIALQKHFRNINNLMDDILEKHFRDAEEYMCQCRKYCKNYPDIHKILMNFQHGVKFQRQLHLHEDIPLCDFVYIHINHLSRKILVPKFMDYYNLKMPLLTAEIMWLGLIDKWYSRLEVNNLSEDMMRQTTDDIMRIMLHYKDSLN